MKEIILFKYGEVALKGLNKSSFERLMLSEIRRRMAKYGICEVSAMQSTIVLEPQYNDDGTTDFDLDGAFDESRRIFGIAGVSRSAVVEKDIDQIREAVAVYTKPYLEGKRTFKCVGKRSDKRFQYNSMQLCMEMGGVVLENNPHLKVDVYHPDITVNIEIRDKAAYVHCGQEIGACGMPSASNGHGLLLLSGGIDSPVAGWMMARRGMKIDALHFESFPYTSERAREKVFTLAKKLCAYLEDIKVNVVSVTHIQEELRDKCEEEYFTLLLRRFMMRIADELAHRYFCHAIITGESLGQVASQTAQALTVTDAIATLPVFRPCIGMDKEEIVTISRKIDTFETSIEPYEDCCTVFTPKHPKTKPELEKVLKEEAKLDVDALVAEALETLVVTKLEM